MVEIIFHDSMRREHHKAQRIDFIKTIVEGQEGLQIIFDDKIGLSLPIVRRFM